MKSLQPLIKACTDLMTSNPLDDITTLCRRIIGACFNGGVALNLLYEIGETIDYDQYKDSIPSNLTFYDPKLNVVNIGTSEIKLIEKLLVLPIETFYCDLYKNASEAQYRVMLWDSVLINLFLYQIKKNLGPRPSEILLKSEWSSKELFPELETRKVDFAAIWSGIPVMIIEMGNGEFGVGVKSHKDFSKSIGLISQACRKLGLELETQGKGAENAQIFGIWIGGTQIHFITGKAVVSEADSPGTFSIQCNLYFPSEWKHDVLRIEEESVLESAEENSETVSEASSSPLRQFGHEGREPPLELQSTPIRTVESFEMAPPVTPVRNVDMDTNTTIEEPGINTPQSEMEPDDQSIHLESDDEGSVENESEDSPMVGFEGHFDKITLVHLNRFIGECVKYMKSIPFMTRKYPKPREFRDPEQIGFIPESRASAIGKTPKENRLLGTAKRANPSSASSKKVRKADIDDYDDFYICEGINFDELAFYRIFMSVSPVFFPNFIEFFNNEEDEELFDIVFEKLDPFLIKTFKSTSLSDNLMYRNSREALAKTLKFIVELLNNLDVLHSIIQCVHADISPNNIMFSVEWGIWKFIDYEDAMRIEQSKIKSRTAGTIGFISPESLETGIFTEASDTFALGRVIHETLYYKLIETFEMRSRRNDALHQLFCKFEKILFKMLKPDPSERIPVRDALLQFFGILRIIPDSFDPDHSVYTRVGGLYEVSTKLGHLEREMEKNSISDASTAATEEEAKIALKKAKHVPEEELIMKSAPLIS